MIFFLSYELTAETLQCSFIFYGNIETSLPWGRSKPRPYLNSQILLHPFSALQNPAPVLRSQLPNVSSTLPTRSIYRSNIICLDHLYFICLLIWLDLTTIFCLIFNLLHFCFFFMLLFGIIEQVHFISIVSLLLIPPRGHIPQFPCFGVFPFASLPSPPKYLHIFNTYILMSSDIGIYLWYHDHNQGDKCMCHIYCICILFSCTTLLSKPMVKKVLK